MINNHKPGGNIVKDSFNKIMSTSAPIIHPNDQFRKLNGVPQFPDKRMLGLGMAHAAQSGLTKYAPIP